MPAPNKIILRVGVLKVSAFDLGDVEASSVPKIVCKICAPTRTKMNFIAQITLPIRDGLKSHYLYTCQRCGRSWAISPVGSLESEAA